MAKKAKESFLITGRVVDRKSQGVAGLKIEALQGLAYKNLEMF